MTHLSIFCLKQTNKQKSQAIHILYVVLLKMHRLEETIITYISFITQKYIIYTHWPFNKYFFKSVKSDGDELHGEHIHAAFRLNVK